MSELKDYDIMDIEAMDDERLEKSESGKIQATRVYIKSEADKVFADLEQKLAAAQQVLRLNEPKALYSNLETMGRLKHEIDVVARRERHQKYKRCLVKKEECKVRSTRYQDLWEKWRKTEYDTSGSYYKNYIKWWHRAMKWRDLAEKFKEAK